MALSDLAVYTEYTNGSLTEVLSQRIELFNQASQGTILLRDTNHSGDFAESTMWALVAGLVRRRNPYGTGTVAEKALAQIVDTMVRIAAGTPPVRMDPAWFEWVGKAPEEAGVVLGQQLADQVLADMVNTAIMASVSALNGIAGLKHDATDGKLEMADFNSGQSKFGDRANAIQAWLMHSTPLFGLYGQALANSAQLFNFGNVNVSRDPFGRLFIVTDSPSLVDVTPDPDQYYTLGLVAGAVVVDRNADYTSNIDERNGNENIVRTFQAEWSYNLGIKGFTWDKTNGGKAPTNAALGTSTNWDRTATDLKDMAGVLIKSQ